MTTEPHPNDLQASARWKNRSKWVLAAIALLTVFSGWRASQIGFNYDFEAFFPQGQPETSFYLQFREAFSTDNDFILVGVKREEGIFNRDFLGAVRALSDTLETLPGVTQVLDPTQLRLPVQDPVLGMVFQRPILRWETPEHYKADSAYLWRDDQWVGSLLSADGKSIALTVGQTAMLSKQGCDDIAEDISRLGTKVTFSEEWHERL